MNSLFKIELSRATYFPRKVIGRHDYVCPDLVLTAEQVRERDGMVVKVQLFKLAKGKILDVESKCLVELSSKFIATVSTPMVQRFEVFTSKGLSQDDAINRIKSGLMRQKLATA
jgi:hypothetical protein